LYGMAWSHPNAGGVAGNLNDHGLLVLTNGGWCASLTGSTRARDDMRAPIFYDNNNTGYYIDPTSTTAIRTVGSWRADSATWDGEFAGKIQYHSSNWYFQYASQFIFRNSGGGNVFYGDTSGNVWSYAYRGNGNVGGTGEASWHPSGIYSGSTQWLYGNLYRNGAGTYDGGVAYYTIMYDNNDSAWYTDPNNVSRMYRAHIGNNGTNYAMLTVLGNIGFTSPASYYYLSSGVGYGSYGNGAQGVGLAIYVDDGSRIICAEYMTHSDRRLKDVVNIISENEGLSFIRDIDPVHYRWKNAKIGNEGLLDRELKTGFIAQDVIRNGFRHLVAAVPKEGLPAETDIYGHTSPANEQFTVDYVQMIPYYHAALRNILKKTDDIEILKQQIATQQAKIEELENRINNS
jgi:hypothetical protein